MMPRSLYTIRSTSLRWSAVAAVEGGIADLTAQQFAYRFVHLMQRAVRLVPLSVVTVEQQLSPYQI